MLTLLLCTALVSLLVAACGDDTTVNNPNDNAGAEIGERDSLSGAIKGTMKEGKTYYLVSDATVNAGDSLVIQPGAKLVDLNNHTLFVRGALLAHGTEDKMIRMGPDVDRQEWGAWGGIQCDSPSVVSLKWCRIDYAGGLRPDGRPRPAVYYFSNKENTSEFYVEDCYFYKPLDDGFLVYGGRGHVLRSTFIYNGEQEGSGINFKTGFTGEIAYNYVWNCVDHAIRIETDANVLFPQTDVDIHNNTIVTYGFRNLSRPGAGVIIDKYAKARIYNNIFVDGRVGIRITQAADAEHTEYGNNLFYTTVDSLQEYFYPPDGVGSSQASDLIQVDPMLTTFVPYPKGTEDPNDPTLRSGSPAIGAGNPKYDQDIGAFTAKRGG